MRWLLPLLVVCGCEIEKKEPPAHDKPVRRALSAIKRPSLPPVLPSSEVAWSTAETSNVPEAWDTAAEAYALELATCTSDCRETAYAIVLARKNALLAAGVHPPEMPPPPGGDTAEPLPPRVHAFVDSLDHYVASADKHDPDAAGMQFLAAHAMWKWRQPDAVSRLEAMLRERRDDPTAEYAANILLDTLLRAGRTDELRAWVAELLADSAFLAGKDELRQTLESLRSKIGA